MPEELLMSESINGTLLLIVVAAVAFGFGLWVGSIEVTQVRSHFREPDNDL